MISRRSLVATLAASAAVAPFTWATHPMRAHPVVRPKLHALILGINTYAGRVGKREPGSGQITCRPIRQLKGAVNDARAIETAVRPLAVTTRVMLEREVTRTSFFVAWEELVKKAGAGDILLLTYAGHGGLEPERVHGSETSGYDQTLIFGGFDCLQRADRVERVVDDEIHQMLLAAEKKGVRVLFVADCCHSGTLTRSVDPRLGAELSYRAIDRYDVAAELSGSANRSNSPPPAPTELSNVVFFAASQDHELVPEIEIDGRPHGALSVAFARALSAQADSNSDGIITGLELATYVRRYIRAITDSGQHPNVRWPTIDLRSGLSLTEPLVYLPTGLAASADEHASSELGATIRLRVINAAPGEANRIVGALKGAELAGAGEEADLTWDVSTGDALNRTGQRLATGIKRENLQFVIERSRTVGAILRWAAERSLDLRLLLPGEGSDALPSSQSDRVHASGARLTCIVGGMRHPHFVLFNITGDATVQHLYPLRRQRDPPKIDISRPFVVPPMEVKPPFGADHVVAIAAASPLDRLTDTLETIDGRRAVNLLFKVFADLMRMRNIQVGAQAIYTAEK